MKKLFNHSNKAQDLEEYDERDYDWDSEDRGSLDDEMDMEADLEEEEYLYADGEEIAEDADWSEDEISYEDEASYEDDACYEEAEYAEEAEEEMSEGYRHEEEYEEDGGYEEESGDEEGYSEAEPYLEEEDDADYIAGPARKKHGDGQSSAGFFAKIGSFLHNMDAMDRIMVVTGVGVLILAIITGSVFVSASITNRQVSDFADVGLQLDGITVIGEEGLMAVADAERAKLEAASLVDQAEEPEEDPKKDYEETGYERQVSVLPQFTSIQKDLKIKFINKKTEKLVPNVPFAVTITDPAGKTSIWSDDDMDGIIYKKEITPGTYKVAMEALTDEKYADYILSTQSQSVEVKEEIDYKKVDVANEVKQESEVNAKQEDTKKNEVVVESSLKDTVAWVESKTLAATYEAVDKNTIPDPMTLALAKSFMRMSGNGAGGTEPPTPDNPTTTDPTTPTGSPNPPTTTTPPPVDPSTTPPVTDSPDPGTTPPSEGPTTPPPATETPTPAPTPTPTPLSKVTVSVNQAALTGSIGGTMAAIATATGSQEGGTIDYIISSDNAAVATATIDAKGNITVQAKAAGTAKLTITANYKDGKPETAGTAAITVTVKDKLAMSLDKTSMAVYAQTSANITAKVANAPAQYTVTATSSDTGKATVSVQGNVVTVTGVAEGSATITIGYTEGTETVTATCAVTVKKHPKDDTATLLKDASGRQVFVMMADNKYREATRADYYTASKFYIRAEAQYTGWQTIDGKVYYFTADSKKVTGEQVIQGAKYNFASDGTLVVGNGTSGIDVSKWNGNIDWNAVKNSGISYVIIRCGYRGSSAGALIADPKFEANIKGATAVGLKVGIYFFSQAVNEIEAVEEASMVLGQIKNYKISYPVFLDVETSGGRGDQIDRATRTAVCKAFCQTIQNSGYTAGVYSNKNWLENKLDASALSAYKIWLAQYAAAPTYKGRYDLWQYRSTGSVTGIKGNVDMNISYLGY